MVTDMCDMFMFQWGNMFMACSWMTCLYIELHGNMYTWFSVMANVNGGDMFRSGFSQWWLAYVCSCFNGVTVAARWRCGSV